MKRNRWQKGVALLALVVMSSALVLRANPQNSANPEQRIKRVENGLLPPVVLKGETPGQMNIQDRMKHYKTPGVSVAVINKGKVEWARGYGTLTASGQQPVTTQTIFQAASLSKPLTAFAALQLVDKHKLTLDENIATKLSSWKVPETEFTKTEKPTLRRILSHTAGFTVSGFRGYASGEPLPSLRQILDGEKPANSQPIRVDIIPGSQFRYSGGGYTVLQQLMIDVTGTSFVSLMQPVLKRLRMTHSTFNSPSAGQSDVASGHLPDGRQIEGGWFAYPELAAAGLWSTPTDLAQFVIELQRSNAGLSNKILSRQLTKSMLSPQIENAGLGLVVDGKGPSTRFSHSGSNVGYKCFLVGYVESGQGAVVMTNSDNGAQLALEILRSIAAEYDWPDFRPKEKVITKIDSSLYDDYVGEYQLAPGAVITISKEGDKLMSQGPGQPRAELLPESETTFFLREVDASFTFVKDQSGKVAQINVRRGGREFQARRVAKP